MADYKIKHNTDCIWVKDRIVVLRYEIFFISGITYKMLGWYNHADNITKKKSSVKY